MTSLSDKPTLVGERVTLRPFTVADTEAMLEIISDPDVQRFTGSVISSTQPALRIGIWPDTRPDPSACGATPRAPTMPHSRSTMNQLRGCAAPLTQHCGRALVAPDSWIPLRKPRQTSCAMILAPTSSLPTIS